jgi:hypothetical protein
MEVLYSALQQELKDNLQVLESATDVKSVLFLMTNDKIFPDDFLTLLLQSFKKPIIGGVFYELIFNSVRKDSGILLIPLTFELKTEIFNFDCEDNCVFSKLEETFSNSISNTGSIFIFTDAFCTGKSSFIEDLFNFFGFKYSFIGAGCGSDSYESFPCIIHNSGVHANAGVIGFTNELITMGVAHGWTSITETLKVTESEANKVISINWEPAFEVYKDKVEKHSGKKFTDANFLEVSNSYPISIVKIDGDMIIRDLFMEKDGTLFCLDNVDRGQYITVANGDVRSLVEGAKVAADVCKCNDVDAFNSDFVFCIDCISRAKFLGSEYDSELKAIGGVLSVNGVLSFGEIANVGHSFLEIYNKTVIVARWEQIS